MRRQPNDLSVVAAAAVVCAAFVLIPAAPPIVRVIGALPLVLILPGYAVVAACFPRHTLDRMAQWLMSMAFSIVSTIVLGLGLYWLYIELKPVPWTLALTALTLIGCGIAWGRRRSVKEPNSVESSPLDLGWRNVVWLGLAVVIGGAAIGIARLPSPPDGLSGYTLLWINPDSSQTGVSQVGVTSQEFTDVSYHLQITLDGHVAWDWPEIKLSPGETWNNAITLPKDLPASETIEAVLYRLDNPDVAYRQVRVQRTQ